MKLACLVLLFAVIYMALGNASQCNDQAQGNGGVLEFDTLSEAGIKPGCHDMKVCAVDCGKILKGCTFRTQLFDVSHLEAKTIQGWNEDGKATSWEKIAYREVCVKRKYGKTSQKDFFDQLQIKIQTYKVKPEGQQIKDTIAKFIEYFRDLAKKCQKKSGWEAKLKQDMLAFKEEDYLKSPKLLDAFRKIQTPIINAFIKFQAINDDISSDKYCNCLNFEAFIGKMRKTVWDLTKRAHLNAFQGRYLGWHRTMRQKCEKVCGQKTTVKGWFQNVGRIIKNSFGSLGYMGKKEAEKRRILKVVKQQLDRLVKSLGFFEGFKKVMSILSPISGIIKGIKKIREAIKNKRAQKGKPTRKEKKADNKAGGAPKDGKKGKKPRSAKSPKSKKSKQIKPRKNNSNNSSNTSSSSSIVAGEKKFDVCVNKQFCVSETGNTITVTVKN